MTFAEISPFSFGEIFHLQTTDFNIPFDAQLSFDDNRPRLTRSIRIVGGSGGNVVDSDEVTEGNGVVRITGVELFERNDGGVVSAFSMSTVGSMIGSGGGALRLVRLEPHLDFSCRG